MQVATAWPIGLRKILIAGICVGPLLIPGTLSFAQEITPEIEQRSDSLDVPFVRYHNNVLAAMFDFAKPTKEDFLIDLGSGDGRIVIGAAESFETKGFGVDLNEGLVRIAQQRAERAGVSSLARFEVRDLYETDFRPATNLTMYLLPEIVQELRPKLLAELRPGTRIVSHDYHLGEWRPDASRLVDISENPDRPEESIIYFWIVPARVAGEWLWTINYPQDSKDPVEYGASITQSFQDIEGTLSVFPSQGRIRNAVLSGTRIAFTADIEVDERIVRHDFTGEADGDRIFGTVKLSGGIAPMTLPWSAQRAKGVQ